MLDSITTNLFVILVYLIPGSMFVFFICYVKPNIFFCRIENEKKSYLKKSYFVIFSLFFGVLLHSLNHTVFYPLERSFSKKIRSEYKEKYLTAYKYLKWKQLGENNNLFIDIYY